MPCNQGKLGELTKQLTKPPLPLILSPCRKHLHVFIQTVSGIYQTDLMLVGLSKKDIGETCQDSDCTNKLVWDDDTMFNYESTNAMIPMVKVDKTGNRSMV